MCVTAPSPSSALMYEVQGNSTRKEMREEQAPSHYRECDEAHRRSSPRPTPSADLYCYSTTDSKGRSGWWSCADRLGPGRDFRNVFPTVGLLHQETRGWGWGGGKKNRLGEVWTGWDLFKTRFKMFCFF